MSDKKWALVTGAARGIGREVALFLAQNGVNVVVHSRDLIHTESLLKELANYDVESFAVAAELSDEAQVLAMADEVLKRVQIDYLFNNAGVQPKLQVPYYEMNAEEYLWTYKINVVAPMITIEKFLPGMLKRKFGRIVNTTSGIVNQPEQGAYAASKGALDKLTKDFASKLEGTGVSINVADPGWVKTDLGGPHASNEVETVVPGMVVAAFAPAEVNGQWISVQNFKGLSLENALEKMNEKVKNIQW